MKMSPFSKALTAALLLTVSAVFRTHAATFTVTNTADSGPGSLRQAVADAHAAAGADIIVFDPAIFGSPQTITLATEIRISPGTVIDTLTIAGPGRDLLTVSGNNVSRIFRCDAGDTNSISAMTLTKGAGGDGGAIQNASDLTLTDIHFIENVTNSGGAIYHSGGALNVLRCAFTSNKTTGTNINGDGGSAMELRGGTVAIYDSVMTGGTTMGGGGAIRNSAATEIVNSFISNNTSGSFGNSDGGGGIYNTGSLTMTGCIVNANTAGGNTAGGGIRNEGRMSLFSSVITGNTAGANGGGVYDGATNPEEFLKITNCTISNNVANADLNNTGYGGGVYAETGTETTIEGSTINGNEVRITATPVDSTRSDGGGIWSDGLIRINRSTISGNTARVDFGGVRVPHNFNDTVVTNSTIVGNTAGRAGGGIGKDYCNLSCTSLTLGNTIVAKNVGGSQPDLIHSGNPNNDRDTGISSLGYNLIGSTAGAPRYAAQPTDIIGVDPNLGPLADNGGLTPTHALQPGSPAIEKGFRSFPNTAASDQRGVSPNDDPNIPNAEGGDGSEIGAFEIGAPNNVAEKTLGNIATRLPVFTGERVLIGGIIVTGDAPKRVIVRALGPSLAAAGVGGGLVDPVLEIYKSGEIILSNDNWRDSQESEIAATGIAPSDDREAAIVATLDPDAYTAILRGRDEAIGVGLVEVYDLEQRPDSKLANISTRGFVGSGEDVLIGGFIVGPTTKVVVRALGPSLGAGGVEGALQDPALDLVNANGEVMRTNDNWKGTQRAEIEAIGIQPSDDRESTLIATLTAGNYTAVVRGIGGNTGVGLVEVYNLP